MTHLEALLHFFKNMDSDMLYEFLPERVCQEKVTKGIFIKTIDTIFDELKVKGDNLILINDNTCKCENCLALDFEKRSFAFFGNLSGDFFCLDFYIIEKKVITVDNIRKFDLEKVIEMKNELFEFTDLSKSSNWKNIQFIT